MLHDDDDVVVSSSPPTTTYQKMPMTLAADDQEDDCHRRAVVSMEISSSSELASAQQRMRILVVSRVRIHSGVQRREEGRDVDQRTEKYNINMNVHDEIDGRKMLSFPIHWCDNRNETTCRQRKKERAIASDDSLPPPTLVRILDALRAGKNRLVLREWKRGACWWNLNANHGSRYLNSGNDAEDSTRPVLDSLDDAGMATSDQGKSKSASSMARAEVAGYRLAKLALSHVDDYSFKKYLPNIDPGGDSACIENDNKDKDQIYIPEVLYFSHDRCNAQHIDDRSQNKNWPWALLSYFDSDNTSMNTTQHHEHLEVVVDCESRGDNNHWSTNLKFVKGIANQTMTRSSRKYHPCRHFSSTMIKTRHEFGFDEPHPRHGRVPTDECFDYAMMILHDVVIPLQSYFFVMSDHPAVMKSQPVLESLRSIGWVDNEQANKTVKPIQYHDMIAVYRCELRRLSTANRLRSAEGGNDERIAFLLKLLDECVNALSGEWAVSGGKPPPLPPVICHMDLQPQNLFFRHYNIHEKCLHDRHGKDCAVASVADWEEACYADPRFELLLICRKVLANREQAEKLWESYSNHVRQMNGRIILEKKLKTSWDVGSLEPWLKLEAVHSLCTLLLQAMNLLGGGRNPWETTSDLWGKIDRERRRLVRMGWLFCDSSVTL